MFPWLDPSTATASSRLQALRETSLAKLVREDLLERILSGQLRPGDRIGEPEVGARLSVSRVPVREALRELESSGLVVSRKHAGVFVREIEPAEVRDLYEMRALFDGFAAARAADLPEGQRAGLVAALSASIRLMKAAEKKKQLRDYYAENLRFHWLIVEASGNRQMAASYQDVVQRLHLARLKNLSQDLGMRTSIKEHEDIAAAIGAGRVDEARALLEQHVGDAWRRLADVPG
jgi:DNA-binding GntR family transcriptional regulator